MKKVIIERNPNGDTRTVDRDNPPTFEEFHDANEMHREDVGHVLKRLSFDLVNKGMDHDYTKFSREKDFYHDFMRTITDDPSLPDAFKFVEGDWYKMHIAAERHHLLNNCPTDVDLLDVIEMIVDMVCASKARGNDLNIPDSDVFSKTLWIAYMNTILKVNEMTEVKGDK